MSQWIDGILTIYWDETQPMEMIHQCVKALRQDGVLAIPPLADIPVRADGMSSVVLDGQGTVTNLMEDLDQIVHRYGGAIQKMEASGEKSSGDGLSGYELTWTATAGFRYRLSMTSWGEWQSSFRGPV